MFQFSNLLRRGDADPTRRQLPAIHTPQESADDTATANEESAGTQVSDRVRRELDEQMDRLTKLLDYVESLESAQFDIEEPADTTTAKPDEPPDLADNDDVSPQADDTTETLLFPAQQWPTVEQPVTLPINETTAPPIPEMDTVVLDIESAIESEYVFDSSSIDDVTATSRLKPQATSEQACDHPQTIKLVAETQTESARPIQPSVPLPPAPQTQQPPLAPSVRSPVVAPERRTPRFPERPRRSGLDDSAPATRIRQTAPRIRPGKKPPIFGRPINRTGGLVQDFTTTQTEDDDDSPVLQIFEDDSNRDGESAVEPRPNDAPASGDAFRASDSADDEIFDDRVWELAQSVVDTSPPD